MGAYHSPEDAYQAFFERFTAKDAAGWAACMSYPHVRVSPPREGGSARTASRFYPTPDDYAVAADWAPFEAAGWVRTEGVEPVRLHESDGMVHLLGGWSRFNAQGEPYLSNRVAYILTRLETGWGIQARFGIDSWDPDADRSAEEAAAVAVLQTALDAGMARDWEAHADTCHFPLTVVAPGQVLQIPSREELMRFESSRVEAEGDASPNVKAEIHAVQSGAAAVNVAVQMRIGGAITNELALVTRRDGKWAIAAASAMQTSHQ